jgi:hypothetical protein
MSDPSEQPSESMPGQDNGLKPLSNAEDLSLGNPSNSELSRIMSRAGIALANGFPLDEDDDEEEVEGDYVAVDQEEDSNEFPYWFRRPPTHHRTKLDELHPFVQLLSTSNVEDCITVENAFPEAERCSRDKVGQTPCEFIIEIVDRGACNRSWRSSSLAVKGHLKSSFRHSA